MERILVYHSAAIGDAVLATPVSMSLKRIYPAARITYATHSSLHGLLSLCPAIDEFISIEKNDGFLESRARLARCRPDLLLDLSGSSKSFLNTMFISRRTLSYSKNESSRHAVENYLNTISLICPPPAPEDVFPTLFPSEEENAKLGEKLSSASGRTLLALVPGVGKFRPHRAWPESYWISLAREIAARRDYALLLVGGADEQALCSRIAAELGQACVDLSGRLNLTETAAALSLCSGTVSGDTGPAHISVAVGTPVLGLYGPTRIERSGPYGCGVYSLSAADYCKCTARKSCLFSSEAGECMKKISVEMLGEKLELLLSRKAR